MTQYSYDLLSLGLSTSCSRFLQKFPVISQKVSRKLLKKSQKLLYVAKVAQKLLKKQKLLVLQHLENVFSAPNSKRFPALSIV